MHDFTPFYGTKSWTRNNTMYACDNLSSPLREIRGQEISLKEIKWERIWLDGE